MKDLTNRLLTDVVIVMSHIVVSGFFSVIFLSENLYHNNMVREQMIISSWVTDILCFMWMRKYLNIL